MNVVEYLTQFSLKCLKLSLFLFQFFIRLLALSRPHLSRCFYLSRLLKICLRQERLDNYVL